MRWSRFALLTPLVVAIVVAIGFQASTDDDGDGPAGPVLPGGQQGDCTTRVQLPAPPPPGAETVTVIAYAAQGSEALRVALPQIEAELGSPAGVRVIQAYRGLVAEFAALEASPDAGTSRVAQALDAVAEEARRAGLPGCAPATR